MSEMRGEVHGSQELRRKLQAIGAELATRITEKALEAGVEVMGDALVARTPVRRGELREHACASIIVAPSGLTGLAKIGFGKQDYKARWVEFGHEQVKGKGESREVIGHVEAHPFMRPTYDATKDEAKEAMLNVFRSELKEIA